MGNITTTPEEKVQARFRKHVKRDKKRQHKYLGKNRSVRTVSGGPPSLGKRR